jgi:hypothetical protein
VDIYLYYTIREADAAVTHARVAALQRRLAGAYDIKATVRRRRETRDGVQTWMEIYPDVPAGFDSVIEQAAREEGLTELATSGRHIEVFMELPPCA